MESLLERVKRGLNVYVKNSAEAAAIATVLTNKDCSAEDLLALEGIESALPAVLTLLDKEQIKSGEKIRATLLKRYVSSFQKRVLFLVCGASSVGKDTAISAAKHALYLQSTDISYVDKYTTRGRRGFEHENLDETSQDPSGNYRYYRSLRQLKRENPDAVLGYKLYTNHYAFSGDHINSEEEDDKNLLCIYGRFENIVDVKREVLEEFKRIPIAILLTAPETELERRLQRRASISSTDKNERAVEIRRQVEFIENNPELIHSGFDHIIESGDKNSAHEVASILSGILLSSIKKVNAL